jgi:hypothetical protein
MLESEKHNTRHWTGVALPLLLLSSVLASCAAIREDPSSSAGKQAILFKVNSALTRGDCATAIAGIEPLYNSPYSDDEVRRLRASAHACHAGINFFSFIGELASGTFAANTLWSTITKPFAQTAGTAARVQSSFYSTDALLAMLTPGAVIASVNRIEEDPYNLGSSAIGDHPDEAQLYLVLTSMATIGTVHTKLGANASTGAPSSPTSFTWTSLASVDQEACGYASSVLMLFDSLGAVGSSYSQLSSVASTAATVSATMGAVCQLACQTYCPTLSAAGLCTSSCPSTLRHRTSCDRLTPTTEDLEACGALGVISAMEAGWQ